MNKCPLGRRDQIVEEKITLVPLFVIGSWRSRALAFKPKNTANEIMPTRAVEKFLQSHQLNTSQLGLLEKVTQQTNRNLMVIVLLFY